MLYYGSLRVRKCEAAMATREREFTIDDVWRLACAAENDSKRYTIIDGELIVSMSPGYSHARIAGEIARRLGNFVVPRGLGDVTVESGHYPPQDRRTLLLPDVAFISKVRTPPPDMDTYAPLMPDLAVEIISPSQTLEQARRKAAVYLQHGTGMVWLVNPAAKSAEVWSAGNDDVPQSEIVDAGGELSGGTVLPGFTLPLRKLFQRIRNRGDVQ